MYKYKGKYLAEYCRENGIKYSTIYNYMYKTNFNVDDAMRAYYKGDLDVTRRYSQYTYKGMKLSVYCKKKGIRYIAVYMNIYRGKSINDAVKLVEKKHDKKQISQ